MKFLKLHTYYCQNKFLKLAKVSPVCYEIRHSFEIFKIIFKFYSETAFSMIIRVFIVEKSQTCIKKFLKVKKNIFSSS